jgi:hypothetical protein
VQIVYINSKQRFKPVLSDIRGLSYRNCVARRLHGIGRKTSEPQEADTEYAHRDKDLYQGKTLFADPLDIF